MKLSQLYEADETAWLEKMSRIVKRRQFEKLDCENLSEFLLSMAKRDRREVFNRLVTLLVHVLKWQYQPLMRSRSWELTIREQQDELRDEFESKTLKNHALENLSKAYSRALLRASGETGLEEDAFPPECPYTLDELLAEKPLPRNAEKDES